MTQAWTFYRHMPVYLAGGKRLGHVAEVGHAVDFLRVQQGRLLVRDWYIPASDIEDVSERGALLRSTMDGLRRDRLYVPPGEYLERQGATPGYEYTSLEDIPSYGAARFDAEALTLAMGDTGAEDNQVEAT